MIGRTKIILAVAGIIGAGAGGCALLRNYLQKPQLPIGGYGDDSPWPDDGPPPREPYAFDPYDPGDPTNLGEENPKPLTRIKEKIKPSVPPLARRGDGNYKALIVCDRPGVNLEKKAVCASLLHPSVGLPSSLRSIIRAESKEESDK